MDTMSLHKSLRLLRTAAELLGQDATNRQVLTLLMIAEAGEAGAEQASIEKATESAQSTTSRNLKLMCQEHGLAEFFLDPADGRRRLVRLTKAGRTAVDKLLRNLA
ncbi:hypothetical protein [Stenotrophomonas muris]|uniref:hypothetical protein n=1 Tax=Stenotrophomonas muris TaxID=2963283 RepID=UPI0040553FA1